LAGIAKSVVNGLTVILIVIIALLLGTGLGALVAWQGQIRDGDIIMSILLFGSLLGVTALSCWCLGAWLKEQ